MHKVKKFNTWKATVFIVLFDQAEHPVNFQGYAIAINRWIYLTR